MNKSYIADQVVDRIGVSRWDAVAARWRPCSTWYAAGFTQVAQKGSHVKFAKREGGVTRTAVVPRHREVAAGTLRSILKQAGLDVAEFAAL